MLKNTIVFSFSLSFIATACFSQEISDVFPIERQSQRIDCISEFAALYAYSQTLRDQGEPIPFSTISNLERSARTLRVAVILSRGEELTLEARDEIIEEVRLNTARKIEAYNDQIASRGMSPVYVLIADRADDCISEFEAEIRAVNLMQELSQ